MFHRIIKRVIAKLVLPLFTVLALLTSQVASVHAQSIYETLQTPFYDPSPSSDCLVADVASDTNLPSDIIKTINRLKPLYVQASQVTKVPWQVLAAIHYRETGLSLVNPNDDGLYQIVNNSYPIGPVDQAAFLKQSIDAGNFVQSKTAANLPDHRGNLNLVSNDPENIKDIFFSYNGRASAYANQAQRLGFDPNTQPYEGSPYVMNNFDEVHQNMGIITGQHGSGTIDGTDTRFGAFTIYSKLGGDNCTAAVLGDAVQTAIKYAWTDHHEPNYFVMKPEYKKAINAAISRGEYVGGGSHPGIDCGGFITRVMRDSGADPNYNQYEGPTTEQQRYMDDHPEKYQKLSTVNGTDALEPGDIAIHSTHTYMYVGSQPGFNGNSASASFSATGRSWRTPMADNAYGFADFSWYRLKK